MPLFGLIGYPLGHSFSKKFFTQKFENQGLVEHRYELFPLADIAELPKIFSENPDLRGLNVTLPHKQSVIPFLDKLDESAADAGAVNCIRIERDGRRVGFNTDVFGFEISLKNFLAKNPLPTADFAALILGGGGAAQAVAAVFRKLKIQFLFVSRRAVAPSEVGYEVLPSLDFQKFLLIVNTTPLGMSPDLDASPDFPFEKLGSAHRVFDLIYNPSETKLMRLAAARGAAVANGLEMLHLQAERSWEIWSAEN